MIQLGGLTQEEPNGLSSQTNRNPWNLRESATLQEEEKRKTEEVVKLHGPPPPTLWHWEKAGEREKKTESGLKLQACIYFTAYLPDPWPWGWYGHHPLRYPRVSSPPRCEPPCYWCYPPLRPLTLKTLNTLHQLLLLLELDKFYQIVPLRYEARTTTTKTLSLLDPSPSLPPSRTKL